MDHKIKVAIIIVGYNGSRYVEPLFDSLLCMDTSHLDTHVLYLDNASQDESFKKVEKYNSLANNFTLNIERSEINHGYAGGNTLMINKALSESFDYVYLLNQDTRVEKDFLQEIVKFAIEKKDFGAIQSFVCTYPDTSKINSSGNYITCLGMGYAGNEGSSRENPSQPILDEPAYFTGAGVLLSCEALKKVGSFESYYFMYHEDIELSARMLIAGYKIYLAKNSIIYHEYEFASSIKLVNFMERNRVIYLLTYYDFLMLLLILPAFIGMEVAIIFYSIKNGWFKKKIWSYTYFFKSEALLKIFEARVRNKKFAIHGPEILYKRCSAKIESQHIQNPILDLANVVMEVYWGLVKKIYSFLKTEI